MQTHIDKHEADQPESTHQEEERHAECLADDLCKAGYQQHKLGSRSSGPWMR
jgi:hypothetical protein